MRLLKKKDKAQEETEKDNDKEILKKTRLKKKELSTFEKPRDSTRWFSLLFLLIFLFLSYLSWVAY